ncbi:hypothetical protein [Allohahella marinimesophila]|uniref:Virulence factor lipase-like protein n=1 Tax=Allohahella marinimesophila TaxID=1054972 RepID=A0ABP7P3A1_9GAMM
MLKRTLLSLAIGSTVFLAGCGDNGDSRNAGAISPKGGPFIEESEGRSYPLFNPARSLVPVPSDIQLDQVAGDGTFGDAPAGSTNPVQIALGKMSGASLIAPIDIAFEGGINEDSVSANLLVPAGGSLAPNPGQNVFLIELAYPSGDPIQGLSAQETPTIPFAALLQAAGSNSNAAAAVQAEAVTPSYVAKVLDLEGTTVLRIQPTKPLKPKTRYLVVVTDSILDEDGQPIVQDPAYRNITDPTQELPSAALAGVRTIVNGFWEQVGGAYLAGATNGTRSALGLPLLSADNIAISFSFTTTADEKVTEYLANPGEWFVDQLTTSVRLTASMQVGSTQTDVNGDGAVDYFDRTLAANAAIEDITASDISPALATTCTGTGPAVLSCIGATLAAAPPNLGGFRGVIEAIAPRPVVASTAPATPVALTSAPIGQLLQTSAAAPGYVDRTPVISQGTITLPYFLGIPEAGSDGSVIQSSIFVADGTLASAMNSALGLPLPQGATAERAAKSDAVNYLFPFPKKQGDLETPYIAIYPFDRSVCPAQLPVVIYQHGITADRSAGMAIGSLLADKCFATLAIDLPLHGVAPYSTAKQRDLAITLLAGGGLIADATALTPTEEATVDAAIAGVLTFNTVKAGLGQDFGREATEAEVNGTIATVLGGGTSTNAQLNAAIPQLTSVERTLANAGSVVPGLAPYTVDDVRKERHFEFTSNASAQAIPMNYNPDAAVGSSGSLYINPTGFVNERDKNRQATIDLLNMRASLTNFETATGLALDESNVFFVGHSLGTVAGTVFTAVANSVPPLPGTPAQPGGFPLDIKATALLTPASGLARMIENSPSFAPPIVGGLAAAGVAQGSLNFETFLRVLQASQDPTDPVNFADNLKKGPTFAQIAAASAAAASATNPLYDTNSNFQTSAEDVTVLDVELTGRADANGNAQVGTEFISDQTTPIETAVTQLTTQFGTALPDLLSGNSKFAALMGAQNVLTSASTANHMISRIDRGSHSMFVLPRTPAQNQGFGAGVTSTIALFSEFAFAQAGAVGATLTPAVQVSEEEFQSEPRNGRQLNP